jgi:trehalose 6-phosphate synthase/phosphatase
VSERRQAKHALILLDYDGTLVPIAKRPELAAPDPELLDLLSRLAALPRASVFVISGRERASLAGWFAETPIGIIAEHGAWLREPGPPAAGAEQREGGGWRLTRPISAAWKEQIAAILRPFVGQVAGSFLEEKDFSLAWHYRNADPDLGAQRAKELVDELTQYTANLDIHVLEGKKVVEVRTAGVNKGAVAVDLVHRLEPDFILAVGDDQTDEDVFLALPPAAISVHVGSPLSNARFCVSAHVDVRRLLERLIAGSG